MAGCAGQVPPSGGPLDRSHPQIVYSSPTQKELSFNSQKIVLRFDKYMMERTVENAVYFPPFSAKEIEYDWSGKELTMHLLTPLEKNRTYILTIGAGAQNLRGNTLGKAISIVFSTGSHIDTGSVTGKVYSNKLQPYTVAAYQVTDSIDTLRPSIDLAKYVTQSDDSGRFVMQGLANGKYRLICFDDQVRNFTYATQIDKYASATHDVEITDSSQNAGDVNFTPTPEDTSLPQLYSAELTNDGSLLLKFSKAIDSASVSPGNFSVRDSITSENYPFEFAVRREENQDQIVLELSKPLTLRQTYIVKALKNVTDLQFNRMSPANNTVSLKADTNTVRISPFYFSFPDSLQDVTTYDTLFCQFISASVFDSASGSEYVSLRDSSGASLPGAIIRQSATVFKVSLGNLNSLSWYKLELKFPLAGKGRDSVVSHQFRMVDFSSLGNVEGEVKPYERKIVVIATKEDGKRFIVFANPGGKFSIEGIPGGTYSVSAFVQHGKTFDYFRGTSFPFQFAEPFGVYEDPVKVRARWTSEGVSIMLH